MHSLDSLVSHLLTRTPEELTELTEVRPDVALEPAPTRVEQLARRLLDPASMTAACALTTRPQLQVAEAAAALGRKCTVAGLAELMGVAGDDPDLAAAVHRLTELALI
ncbi:hypothetical protein JIG36_46350 [Actinoplanes sp. LDG1-06]|uniref:Uncharacterized protein n=1 Tax=Paractinoplanes ovalisporus TaxID=2810368 RepID=A0ABS2ASZ3_9ACTN|nr:hypothetical protein [Actinoplanes ovalisporus]MBM2622946.1 hypothetical protein [Actinoplanes ovalisporus]